MLLYVKRLHTVASQHNFPKDKPDTKLQLSNIPKYDLNHYRKFLHSGKAGSLTQQRVLLWRLRYLWDAISLCESSMIGEPRRWRLRRGQHDFSLVLSQLETVLTAAETCAGSNCEFVERLSSALIVFLRFFPEDKCKLGAKNVSMYFDPLEHGFKTTLIAKI